NINMDLHSKIIKVYRDQFLKVVQGNNKLNDLMLAGNSFDCPDIAGGKTNYENKVKYLSPDYAIRVADKLNKIMPDVLTSNRVLKILDIGCGFGQYAVVFKHFG